MVRMSSTSALDSPAIASSEIRSLGRAAMRPRQLELAHLDLGQPRRPQMRLRLEPDHAEDLQRPRGDVGPVRPVVRRVLERDVQVLEHGHARERLGNLEGPHDAEPGPAVGGHGR